MTSLVNESTAPAVREVRTTAKALRVWLEDGRELSVPIEWYPRLAHGTTAERSRWELVAAGTGIHWPDLDEDISVAGLLSGLRSGERASSLKRWLRARSQAPDQRPSPAAAVRERRPPYRSGKRRRA